VICIKCRQEYDEENHECLEVMTLDELFQHELKAVRAKMDDALHPTGRCTCAGEGTCRWCNRATVPPGQSPEDEEFKP